jgi:tetratricopeptide (TPR) repeat protein
MNDVGRALKLDSSNTEYYLLLADLKLIAKESRESRDVLLKAYAVNPNDVEVLLGLGELYMIVQDADASFRYLNEALKIDVYNATAYRLKGFNYKYLGDTTNAVSSFQTAVEQDPKDYDSYLQLGLLYSTIGHAVALDYYNNALKVRPTSVEALYAKGLFLQTIDRSREALNTYATILEVTENRYFDAWYNMGYVYLVQLQSYDSAAYSFSQAIRQGPQGYAQAFYNRGLSYEKLGEMKKAEADYREALRINPQYDLAALGLSRILEEQ